LRDGEPSAADELAALAGQVRRLRPDWRDAEAFYEARSEITGALMRLSRRLALQPVPPLRPLRPVPVRVVPLRPVLRIGPPVAPPPATPPRPRRQRHHRYPLPPRSADQPQLQLEETTWKMTQSRP
jgi:hypothetical protein